MVTVTKHRPLEGKLLIDSLGDETRVRILKFLLERWRIGVTAGELAEALDLKIPTIMEHLNLLEESGLIRFQYRQRGGRMLKVYELVDTVVTLQLDLELFVSIPNRTKLEELGMQYFTTKRKQGLKTEFSIDDVAKTLGLDQGAATVVYDFVASRRDEFTRIVGMDILKELREKPEQKVDQLAVVMKGDVNWVKSAVGYLANKGYVVLEGDLVKVMSIPNST